MSLKVLKFPAKPLQGQEEPQPVPPVQPIETVPPVEPVEEMVAITPPPSLPVEEPPSDLFVLDQILESSPCAFVSGEAGTGKTYLARAYAASHAEAILCATTGIAAVNMGDATTINALLGYFDTASLMSSYASGYLQARLRRLKRAGLRTLVLDEVSMLDADQLTVLMQALDEVNTHRSYDASLEEVQEVAVKEDQLLKLVLIGDFAQLPPVKAPFAFESPEWHRFEQATLTLSEIRRQADRPFIDALRAVRRGRGAEARPILEPCCVPTIDFAFDGTTIVGKNEEVDRINNLRHAKLPGEPLVWKTVRSGEQQKDWIKLIPQEVALKPGALVMVLANRSLGWDESGMPLGYAYVNGDLGTVVGLEKEGIAVTLQRTGETVTILPLTSEWKEPTGQKNPAYTVRGAVTRMPLRLAWATTVHKSQGLSLDRVQVPIAGWMFKQPGTLYVALSRARTLQGLRIVGAPQLIETRAVTDKRIGRFL